MKIILEDTTKMTVKSTGYSTIIFGLIFVIMGLAIAILFNSGNNSDGLFVIGFGAIFVLVGLWIVISAKFTVVILDKNYSKGFFTIRTLIKKEEKEVDLRKIKGLILECWHQSDSDGGTNLKYRLDFVMTEGQNVSIDFGGQGGLSISGFSLSFNPHQKRIEEAQKIADFLGVNMTFIPPPSFTDALKALKDGIGQGMKQDKKER